MKSENTIFQSHIWKKMASAKGPQVPEFEPENKNIAQFLLELQGWCDCVDGVVDVKKIDFLTELVVWEKDKRRQQRILEERTLEEFFSCTVQLQTC